MYVYIFKCIYISETIVISAAKPFCNTRNGIFFDKNKKRKKRRSHKKSLWCYDVVFLSEFKSRDCSFELIIFPNGHHFLCFYLPDTSVAPTLSQTSLTSFINNVIEYTSEGGSLDCFQSAFFAIVFFSPIYFQLL